MKNLMVASFILQAVGVEAKSIDYAFKLLADSKNSNWFTKIQETLNGDIDIKQAFAVGLMLGAQMEEWK